MQASLIFTDKLMKSTGLIQLVGKLHQAGKIQNLHQVCGVFGCLDCLTVFSRLFYRRLFRHQRFEWERKDETDYGKRKVYYDASSGEAKILDQTDSGEKSSQQSKVEYNAKSEEARILGVGDNKAFQREKAVESSAKNGKDDVSRTKKFNDYQMSSEVSSPTSSSHVTKESKSFSETHESKKTEVKNVNIDQSKSDYVKLQAAPVQRERLQPIEAVPRQTAMTSTMTSKNVMSNKVTSNNVASQGAVKSYTNLGYSHTGQNADLMSNVQFQQPVAVIKAFVHPGSNTARG